MSTFPPLIHVVDDDESLRIALLRLLGAAGFEARGYASVGDFLLQPPLDHPGCVLLDVRMPGPSGLDLQAALRRQGNPLPVVFLTGYADVIASVRAMKAGTLWVEHPMYTQVMYVLESVPALVKALPELAKVAPFSTVLEVLKGDHAAIAKLTEKDLIELLAATSTGMSVETFSAEAKKWLAEAKDPRWKKPYTELTYLPMQDVLKHLRANGYKTYIVTGGGQDFVRVYSERVYGIPPEQVVGTAGGTKYGYDKAGKPFLTKEPKLLLNDNNAGKPEGIHLMISRRPHAAFGNSTGDRQMLEYTKAGDGVRLAMLVLHDDAQREYAYGPAEKLPDTKVGAFTQALYDEAKKGGWIVISMKNDWKRIFAFEP